MLLTPDKKSGCHSVMPDVLAGNQMTGKIEAGSTHCKRGRCTTTAISTGSDKTPDVGEYGVFVRVEQLEFAGGYNKAVCNS